MDFVYTCGLALCVLAFILIIKQTKTGAVLPLSIALGIILLKSSYSLIGSAKDGITNLLRYTTANENISVLGKVYFISLLTEITSDICRESGESYLAKSVETAGKAEIILLCIPLIESVFKMIREIMI